MGVSEGLWREEGGIVWVEDTVGGTEGHELGEREGSPSPDSGMEVRREGRGEGGRVGGIGGGGVAGKRGGREVKIGFTLPRDSTSAEEESRTFCGIRPRALGRGS